MQASLRKLLATSLIFVLVASLLPTSALAYAESSTPNIATKPGMQLQDESGCKNLTPEFAAVSDSQSVDMQAINARALGALSEDGTRVVQVALGHTHSAAITSDGDLWMWGWNEAGQLGDGTTTDRFSPVKIMDDAASVALGNRHSAVIKADGTLWMWGCNMHGELGIGGNSFYNYPPVKVMDGVMTVSAGFCHTAAIKSDGTLWIWGCGCFGQLGDGTDYPGHDFYQPTKIMDDVSSVSLGVWNSAAIKTDGTLWAWGDNCDGQIGNGSETSVCNAPSKIMDGVASVCFGGYESAAIKKDGSLWMWGANSKGWLCGDGVAGDHYTPVKVMDSVQLRSVAVGNGHSAIVKEDGSLWTWGSNSCGQLGDGTKTNRLQPVEIMEDVSSVSLGFSDEYSIYSAAIKKDGSLWMWGGNDRGQLGDGTTTDRRSPVRIMVGGSGNGSDEDGYLPSKDAWQFANLKNSIWATDNLVHDTTQYTDLPYALFERALGGSNKKTKKVYDDEKGSAEGGLCYGYLASSQLINAGAPGLSSWAWVGSDEGRASAKEELAKAQADRALGKVSYLGRFNTQNSALGLNMCEFVQLAYIMQYHPDVIKRRHSFAGAKQTLETAKRVTEEGRQLMIRLTSGSVSHVVLAYRVTEDGDTSKIYVYDPNRIVHKEHGPTHASDEEYITVGSGADSLQGWVYHLGKVSDNNDVYMGHGPFDLIGYFDSDVFSTIADILGSDSLESAHSLEDYGVAGVCASAASIIINGSKKVDYSSGVYGDFDDSGLLEMMAHNGESDASRNKLFWADSRIETLAVNCKDEGQPSAVSYTSDSRSLNLSASGPAEYDVSEANESYTGRVTPNESGTVTVELETEDGETVKVNGMTDRAVDISIGGIDDKKLVVSGFDGGFTVAKIDEDGVAITTDEIADSDSSKEYGVDSETGRIDEPSSPEPVAPAKPPVVPVAPPVVPVAPDNPDEPTLREWNDPFSDVRAGEWFYDDVKYVYQHEIMSGYGDGSGMFGAGEALTRAEFAALLANRAGADTSSQTDTTGIWDVAAGGRWYTGAVNWAVSNNVIVGYDNGDGTRTFSPDDAVTREQAMVILRRLAKAEGATDESVLDGLPDASSVSDWARGGAAWAVSAGVITGAEREDGSRWIEPGRNLLREEIAKMMCVFDGLE